MSITTELKWDGKNPKIKKVTLPFQRIEIVNDPREGTESEFPLIEAGKRIKDDWRNKLIWGDNKLVVSSLLKDFAGKVDLIYIDPPFNVGLDFNMKIKIGDKEVSKSPSIIEEKAYRDTWGNGVDTYLQMIYERLLLTRDLLSDYGSIYLHCDWRVNSYIRIILDEIFGRENFINEIIWKRRSGILAQSRQYGAITDTILFYSKTNDFIFEPPLSKDGTEEYVEKRFKYVDETGRRYRLSPIVSPSYSPSLIYEYKGYKPPANGWSCSRSTMERWEQEGKLVFPKSKENRIQRKQYLDEWHGRPIQALWDDIPPINPQAIERLGYDTQKPEKLLDRIIRTSSKEGSIVADFFCGSGTTMAVAEKLGRKWIGCDLGKFAIHTSRKRLMEIQRQKKEKGEEYYAFEILNLGKYERQIWHGNNVRSEEEYVKFILELFKAEIISGYKYLHGKKGEFVVHVGAVDSPITYSEVDDILEECKSNNLRSVYILGWEWEMSVYEDMMEKAKSVGIKLSPLQIPKEVMEPQVRDRKDVKFFELNYLAVTPKRIGTKVKIAITDFIISSFDDLPEELRQNKTLKFDDYIDYWAVDWNIGSHEAFTNMWQTFRTKKEPLLKLETPEHDYETFGEFKVGIKVVDVFGNDTSKTIDINIR